MDSRFRGNDLLITMHNQKLSFTKEEKYFLLRRLHSLAGIVPIGIFFIFHMMGNAKSLMGPDVYNHFITELRQMPFLPLIEISAIAIPLLFHIVFGIVIYLTSKNNVVQYPHFANWRYFLQRLTGIIGVFYIGFHVWETRIESALSGKEPTFAIMQKQIQEPFMAIVYLIGTLSLTYHLANGLWTFLITWGVTVSPRSQKVSGVACMGLFLALSAAWIRIIANFMGWI